MISQRTRGLQSTLLLCQALLIVAALCISMRIAFSYFAGASSLHLDHYPTYGAILVAGLLLESFTRSPERLAISPFQRDFLEHHGVSLRQTLASAGTLFLYLAAAKDAFVSRTVLALTMPLLYSVLLGSNLLLPKLLASCMFDRSRVDRTLLIGPVSMLRRVLPWLRSKEQFGFVTVGILTATKEESYPGVPRLGEIEDLAETLVRQQISAVVFLGLPSSATEHERMVEMIESFGARILILSDLEDRLRHRIVHVEDDGLSFIAPRSEPLEHPFNRFVKRTLDIALALPVILFIFPPLALFVWILQRFQSPGPLFFRQVRAGIQNREFKILKFRTMHVLRAGEQVQAGADGHRAFPAGQWLRRLSLDEIPQFLNVLIGEMSVCGPRPHLVEHNELFAQRMARYSLRAFVKPGVTGLAQVRGFRGDVRSVEDIEQRFDSDIAYIENWRLMRDLAIIFRTGLQIVLFGLEALLRGRRVVSSEGAPATAPAPAEEPAPLRGYLPETTRRSFRHILGLRFFTGSVSEAVALGMEGGLVVAPSAPVLLGLEKDPAQRAAARSSALAITDSGFMVLMWKLLTGEEVTRVSGLAYLKLLLEQDSLRPAGATFWVMPNPASAEHHYQWLRKRGFEVTRSDFYVAPDFTGRIGPIGDPILTRMVQERRPRFVIMAVGGGVQEKLGAALLQQLDYAPAVQCTGAAIGFLSGEQAKIPAWADQCRLGWLFRCLDEPRKFVPRYWEARKLLSLMLQYHGRLPGGNRSASIFDHDTPGHPERPESNLPLLTSPSGTYPTFL